MSHVEGDSLGDVAVPDDVYYGAHSSRASQLFAVAHRGLPRDIAHAFGIVKGAAARANAALGLLSADIAPAIARAADEMADGRYDSQFVVDVFQTGSGTSSNMNANEVIAKRANELLTGEKQPKSPVHPNDHVNLGQSSNDVFPTVIHLAAMRVIDGLVRPALEELRQELAKKAADFDDIIKIGRTHLQDGMPVRLGQEFGGYARMVERGLERLTDVRSVLEEVALGSTAVGTGANTAPDFATTTIRFVRERTGISLRITRNGFESLGSRHGIAWTSAALKVIATDLMKIANDLRLLSSGPRCGLGEIALPTLQPGSSMMPGKVNPVIAEAVCQVAAQVIGNDAAITVGCQSGLLELNVMMPMMADNLLSSMHLLANVCRLFSQYSISGITANRERCNDYVERSLALVTALAPRIGYDRAAALSQRAAKEGRTIRELAMAESGLSVEELDRLLDAGTMTPSRQMTGESTSAPPE